MDLLAGLLIGILLSLCLFLLYDKFKKVDGPKAEKKTAEELRKEKEHKQHYDNMMNFNVEKAYKGGN